jgi:hypothetical protein
MSVVSTNKDSSTDMYQEIKQDNNSDIQTVSEPPFGAPVP